MKYPNIVHVDELKDVKNLKNVNGKWVPARCEGYPLFRIRIICAWMVFTGKADALIWEGQ